MNRFAALLLTSLAALAWPALAQEPPGRVGRVAFTQGEVVMFSDEDRGWEKAYVNSPLTSENSLWTEPGARAEVRIGSTAIRLDDTTQLDLRRLDDEQLSAHVPRGMVGIRIRHFESGERYFVSTPHGRFQILANGRYRVDADDDQGQTRFTVFSGSALLEASGRRVNISAGEAVRLYGEGSAFDFERAAANPFDNWALARDERLTGRESARYVSPAMTGYEDLDEHGSWSVEADLGAVWYPSRVASDWAPYRDGHWTYTRPWGYTWVDDAPWGYAPFHYGRWVYVSNRWGWHPGRIVRRPVWAPALVGWVGRPGWSVTVGSGVAPVVGWYPLAPWDRYQPWYTNSPRHITNVNVIVVGNRPGRFRDSRDWNRSHGATVQTREGFGDRRPVRNTMARVSADAIAALPSVSQPSQVLPSRNEMIRQRPGGNESRRPAASPSAGAPGASRTPFPASPPPSSAPARVQGPQSGFPAPTRSAPQGAPQAAPREAASETAGAPRPVIKPGRGGPEPAARGSSGPVPSTTREAPSAPVAAPAVAPGRPAPQPSAQPAPQPSAQPAPRARESRPEYRREERNEPRNPRAAPPAQPPQQRAPVREAPSQPVQAPREAPQSAPAAPQQGRPAAPAPQPQTNKPARESRESREAREDKDKDDNRGKRDR